MSEFFNTTGKRVRILRQDMGLTQDEMHRRLAAAGTHISRSYISVIERLDILGGTDLVRGLAKVLNTSTDYLLMMTDDPAPYRSDYGEDEPEPIDDAVRQMARQLNRQPETVRTQVLKIVDIALKLATGPEEVADLAAGEPTGAEEAETPEGSPAASEGPHGALDEMVSDYMSRLSPEDQQLAVSKAVEMLLKQGGASRSTNDPNHSTNSN